MVNDATPDAATKPVALPHRCRDRRANGVGSFQTSTLADFLSDLAEIL